MDGNRNADVADRSRDSRTNVDEDTDGSKVKPEGAPMLDLFAEENEPGGYYNPRPPNMPAEAAEAQKVLFGDSGGAGGSSASGFAAEHNPAKKVRVEPPRKPPMPALLELANLIHVNAGSLGGAHLEHTHEAQVASINELIRSVEPDKDASLLKLLSIEGIYVWPKGVQPPPLLTLVKVPEFVGLVEVWKLLIGLDADPDEKFRKVPR